MNGSRQGREVEGLACGAVVIVENESQAISLGFALDCSGNGIQTDSTILQGQRWGSHDKLTIYTK